MITVSEEAIFNLLDGAATPEEARHTEAAIASSAENKALYEELKALHQELQQLPVEAPPVAFSTQLVGKLEHQVLRRKRARRHWLRSRPIQVILICLNIVLAITIFGLPQATSTEVARITQQVNTVTDLLKDWPARPWVGMSVIGIALLLMADRLLLRRFKGGSLSR